MSEKYARTLQAAPLLETSDFKAVFGGNDGNSLPLDEQKLLRQVSTIAFPETKLKLIEQSSTWIYRVRSEEYPHPLASFFVDMRFLEPVEKNFPERKKHLPSGEILLKRLDQLLGTSYVWGGNWHLGIPEMKIYYPPRAEFEKLDQALQQNWLIKGVDCSGLLYEVTDGFTPRNTAWMVSYGQAVPIQGKTQAEIISRLEPLDLIVWKGHVLIVTESGHVIESRCGKGVIKTPLNDALSEILSTRMPVDEWESTEHLGKRFVIRRWHSESLLH